MQAVPRMTDGDKVPHDVAAGGDGQKNEGDKGPPGEVVRRGEAIRSKEMNLGLPTE